MKSVIWRWRRKPKILRALQEGEIQRVGGSETIKVNVRMLAATNKPLEKMVKEKTFREDLYYRLNVVRVPLPALRERMEDVPSLVDYMLKRLARDSKTESKQISPEALAVLQAYDWPGNVRELENLIYRSAVMAQGEAILVKDLPKEVVGIAGEVSSENADVGASKDLGDSGDAWDAAYAKLRAENDTDLLQVAEREMIRRVLVETKGETGAAAKILGMTPATLRKRIERYGLRE
jgi:two-component system nitrogen regulation response regulator GlnG